VRKRVHYVTSGHKIYLRYIYLHSFLSTVLKTVKQFTLNCTAFTLHFYIVPATIDTFIISWDELLHCLLKSAHVLCCQPSCHSSFHLPTLFRSVTAKLLPQRCKQTIFCLWRSSLIWYQLLQFFLLRDYILYVFQGCLTFPKMYETHQNSEFMCSPRRSSVHAYLLGCETN